jgi:Xaa-Pro aminopeptidase
MLECRINRLRAILQRESLDAILLLGPVNLRYFCGFSGTDGALIVTSNQAVFLTDSRYTAQAGVEVQADAVREYREKIAGIHAGLAEAEASRIGFDSKVVSVHLFEQLQKGKDEYTFQPVNEALSSIRHIKDESEIALLEEAAHLNSVAFKEVLPLIRPGVSEREIAIELEFALRRLGGEDRAFDYIVASGDRGALPHGVASNRKINRGELVTIDFGTRVNGYYSDETVTLGVGEVPASLRKVYDVVLRAQQLALEALEVSVPAKEVDRVARQYIEDQGYGKYFGHGLGHGVGLEVHEGPTLSPRSDALLSAGMVFTIEPGIYIPGVGGVRIEDTVLMTVDGYRRLTQCPKQYYEVTAG